MIPELTIMKSPGGHATSQSVVFVGRLQKTAVRSRPVFRFGKLTESLISESKVTHVTSVHSRKPSLTHAANGVVT